MRPREYAELTEDIQQNGIAVPLDIVGNLVLDGRHRLQIAKSIGLSEVPVRHILLNEELPLTYILRMAVLRRHLNDDQRAALAALWKRECARRPGRPSRKDHDAVEDFELMPAADAPNLFNVPRRKVDEATYLLHHAPERLEAVHRGDMKLREAARETRVEEQILKVAQMEPATGEFPVIVVDPPWPQGRLPYPTMSLEEIKSLKIPSAADCVLWLWTTNGFMHEAFHVLEVWAFEPKAILTWVKDRVGTGVWLRGQTEHCIMSVRGKPLVDLHNQSTALFGPLREHSRKPDEFFELVRRLCPASGFLEMFARGQRDGWTCWGAEAQRTKPS